MSSKINIKDKVVPLPTGRCCQCGKLYINGKSGHINYSSNACDECYRELADYCSQE